MRIAVTMVRMWAVTITFVIFVGGWVSKVGGLDGCLAPSGNRGGLAGGEEGN